MDFNRRDFLKANLATGLAIVSKNSLSEALAGPVKSGTHPVVHSTEKLPGIDVIALNRMAFGPTPMDFETFRRMGTNDQHRLAHYVEQQLFPDAIPDLVCDKKFLTARLPTLQKSLKQLWADHVVEADQIREMNKMPSPTPSNAAKDMSKIMPNVVPSIGQDEQRLRHEPVRETEIATWLKAVYSKKQLQEVLADFWHNHFNVFGWDEHIAPVFVHYDRDVIRRHSLGNFREMLEAVAESPAMLYYLDNFINQSGNANENFARELFELHTLGAENYLGTRDRTSVPGYAEGRPVGYVDGDVYEAARCLTGWRIDQGKDTTNTGSFAYYDPWHDRFQKIVLGHPMKEYQPPQKDGRDVLDLLANHMGTARYVCRKLCRRFITDIPSDQIVESSAKIFHEQRKSHDQLRQVVRHILLSKDFSSTWQGKMKRPFEVTASLLRATGADFYPSDPFLNNYQRAGQRHFQWRSPDGYPDSHERWAGTSPMIERWRLSNMICDGKIELVSINPSQLLDKLIGRPAKSPERLVQLLGKRMLGRNLSLKSAKPIVDFLTSGDLKEKLPSAIALITMSPEFQWK